MKHFEAHEDPCARDVNRLSRRRHDVLVIGGGINGAGISRDLAMRGLRVALLEKGDFASGTSSASTKLIHGGLRYLERRDFRLVFESCRERRILQKIAPHLVRPLPFLIPVYREDPRPLSLVRAGLTLYDLLALFRNTGRHRMLSPQEALAREPVLRREGLTGAALYWDCRMDDARLCLENVLAAREAGAQALNYVEVVGLLHRGARVAGVRAVDRESGAELEVEAEVIVNASGPWLDRICALDGEREEKLRPTRGTHILVPRIDRGGEAIYLTAGRDDRLFFVLPWGGLSLVGTTDVDDRGDPDTVTPTEEDIAYLLNESARHLRGGAPVRSEVIAAFSGLRPLIAAPDPGASHVSREHRVFESSSGLLSVGGGKYTTYRCVAAEVAARVAERLGRGRGRSLTGSLPLPGGATGDFLSYVRRHEARLAREYGVDSSLLPVLFGRYGSRTEKVLARCRGDASLLRSLAPDSHLLGAEVLHAAEQEMARSPEDILRRRTPVALGAGRGVRELEAVTTILGDLLGASEERRRRWHREYLQRYSNA